MSSLFPRLCLVAVCLVAQSRAATIVGLNFSGGPDGSLYDIVTTDTDTGRQKTLVRGAFQDLWGGSFVTDPAAGIGYVAASNVTPFPNFSISTELLRYDLTTGEVLRSPKLAFGGPLALGPEGKLVGVHSKSASSCDIVTINPMTGAAKTLVANAFKDFWFGSFISDRAAGIGYVITESRVLLQYDLSTGRTIAKVPLSFGGALALAPDGKLVGIRGGGSSSDVVSIDPKTGRVTSLISNAFPDYYGDTFATDVAAGIGCVFTSDRKLFVFDLVTGAVRALAHPLKREISYAAFGRSENPQSPKVVYTGKRTIVVHQPVVVVKGRATGAVRAIRYRVAGMGPARTAKGTTNWQLKVRVKRGVNTLLIRAVGPEGRSLNTAITITRQ